jgi:hypothetical protein
MDIKRYIEEAHENFVSAGEYRCPECDGNGDFPDPDGGAEWHCKHCNGTGIDPRKNIGELLMRIVWELCKAEEAHREDRFAKESKYCNFENIYQDINGIMMINPLLFENNFANTHEDHIAMASIRIFDLCGYLELEPFVDLEYSDLGENESVEDSLVISTAFVIENYPGPNEISISSALSCLYDFCVKNSIPIEKHIEARFAYDKANN